VHKQREAGSAEDQHQWLAVKGLYSSKVQQRHPSEAAEPIVIMLPDLARSLRKLDHHEFTPKWSATRPKITPDH
jgi:hypothetical protein